MSKVSHPNIVRIIELLYDDSFYYIVSEYLKHGDLFDYANDRHQTEEGPLSEQEIIKITEELFRALNFMHS